MRHGRRERCGGAPQTPQPGANGNPSADSSFWDACTSFWAAPAPETPNFTPQGKRSRSQPDETPLSRPECDTGGSSVAAAPYSRKSMGDYADEMDDLLSDAPIAASAPNLDTLAVPSWSRPSTAGRCPASM